MNVMAQHASSRIGPEETAAGGKPLRICFPFTGDAIGGSHLSALGLLCELDRERFQPLVVVQYPDGKIARLFREHGIEVVCPFDWPELPFNQRIGLNAIKAAIAQLGPQIRFLRENRIDIVHSNDGRTHVAWALAAKAAGAKLLWHHRGNPDARGLRYAAPLLADRVLTVSEFALPRPGLFSAANKAQVVHSPFDTDIRVNRAEARAALIKELGVPPETLLVAYSGVFVDRKRPLLFIDAIRRMRELAPDRPVMGLMFGAAEVPEMDEAMQARIAESGLGDTLRLMGWRTNGTYWIAASDVLMIPAVDEPFGRTLVEAMLVGTPIVATRSGGNVEALRDGDIGKLVEPENPTALAEATLALAESDMRALAEKARTDALTRFGIDLHCRQVSQAYDSMMGRRG
ncbi:glycosyltransferase involved in cell wall biosynthesis [Altererythrobacter atlanticus]|uniref:D-inositol 3-phosphate glycosyltransferase n=1 Tax=Croceibacterium atlanticum TaxID=1267766 RepID=A0A0F7KUH7_9SPHN|nr:glycosyltransferase family 4 protein [Croceibacterium atlanticum]AKH42841.1 D-inositol 3-phosphate glycosyltransferase [Croceibacterium atlanticum]MBB5731621.1 glycosyltransferase involved in cell wall biosynthesis [Croceibacterium atlanticum]